MSRIFWDTNLFIYWLEGQGKLAWAARRLHAEMLTRGDHLYTSALAIAELLVKSMEAGDDQRCRTYEQTISALATVLRFDIPATRSYARIRRDRTIGAADAVHLACASAAGMDLFVTNDARLNGKRIDGIQFIVPLKRAPL